MRCRALLAVAALVTLVTVGASCLSPTLPLPPPDLPDAVMEDENGLWQVSGHCLPGSLIKLFDTATDRGVLYQDVARNGTYTMTLQGTACDVVWLGQETEDGTTSPITQFQLEPYAGGLPVDAGACP